MPITKKWSAILATLAAVLMAFGISASAPWIASANEGDQQTPDANLNLRTSVDSGSITSGALTVSGLNGTEWVALSPNYTGYTFQVSLAEGASSTSVTVESSNSTVAAFDAEAGTFELTPGTSRSVYFSSESYGTAVITVTCGSDTVKFDILRYETACPYIWDASKYSYNQVRLQWFPTSGTSGVYIQRAKADANGKATGDFKTIKTLVGSLYDSSWFVSGIVNAPWNKAYVYRVVPFADFHGVRYKAASISGETISFTLPSPDVVIKSIKQTGKKALKITWTAEEGAKKYAIYRSTSENRNYKRIATTTKKTYTDKKVKPGKKYYYRVIATFANKSKATSSSFAKLVAKKSSVLRAKIAMSTVGFMIDSSMYGNYYDEHLGSTMVSNYCAHPARMMYYTQDNRVYMVVYTGYSVKISGLTSSGKVKTTKEVKLPDHDYWGGVYHGPDGNNYVAIGFKNAKDSKKKTVIKVIKYNSKWKKSKTAAIKGAASNRFAGIETPFALGNASFDMTEDGTLYMATSRKMFSGSSGASHQSNIAFKINTKTMKAKTNNLSYASHSFNQIVRFKDGNIYLLDHGDAYPRAIRVTMQERYGKSSATTTTVDAFEFEGLTGQNETGATVGGMEVSGSHVLVCGTAEPHGYEVGNATGFGYAKQNVFVTAIDRKTGETKLRWLTNFDPDSTTKKASECRMIKVSEDVYAVLYTVSNTKKKTMTFYCTAINGSGKKIASKSKTYKNIYFSGSSQPVLLNGSICWVETFVTTKSDTMFYSIPAPV